ncbi:MAG: Flp pilus assembly protein CpaB [Candidatus Omnitrophota bacterium]
MPQIKKFLPLIISAAIALVLTAMINSYIQQKSEEARKTALSRQQSLSRVVVAKVDIPAGATIKEDMLKEETVPKNVLQPRAASSIDRIVDKIAIVAISKGEQVLLNKVNMPGQEASLAMKVPSGKRAISVPIDNISAVGGMIKPGDHVDIVGWVPIPAMNAEGKQVTQMSPMPLFQDVLVLAVGQDFTTGSSKGGGSPLITFALNPQEANLIAFVQEQGKIRLILRAPGDTQVQPAAPVTWETLFRVVMPQAFQQQPEADTAPKRAAKTVDIYRGLNKETMSIE